MNVKTYRAKSMQEALALVRSELGPQASVLSTRELRPRGLRRFWNGEDQVEVVASDNVSVPSRLPGRQPVMQPMTVPAAHAGFDLTQVPAALERDLGHRQAIATVPHAEFLARVQEILATDHLDPHQSTGWLAAVRQLASDTASDFATQRALLIGLLEQRLPVTGPIRCTPAQRRIVALVGPTGVGKTTTLAKLAAHLHLQQQRRVGLLTLDTFRVAAVEQLREYARILEVPFEVAGHATEIGAALRRLSGVELLLVDTSGCSQRDTARLHELQSQLAVVDPHEIHLVLSAVASGPTLAHTCQQFRCAAPTALLMTKLDEAEHLAPLVGLADRSGLPFSYVTAGQQVPSDIEVAQPRALARAILGSQRVCAEPTATRSGGG